MPQDRGHKDLRLPTPGVLTPLGIPGLLAERVSGDNAAGRPIFCLSRERILLPSWRPFTVCQEPGQ